MSCSPFLQPYPYTSHAAHSASPTWGRLQLLVSLAASSELGKNWDHIDLDLFLSLMVDDRVCSPRPSPACNTISSTHSDPGTSGPGSVFSRLASAATGLLVCLCVCVCVSHCLSCLENRGHLETLLPSGVFNCGADRPTDDHVACGRD
ncbi:hypothetical protein RRG08_037564 [Elysia crispata]|uniref:Uncharacterized protein n=1 Tax=Elysia crispata TaxID=231223 RepID=A0AAE0Y732_9GAST|nr:hypothetical protein RRG08_037564 [Elysia crispata]